MKKPEISQLTSGKPLLHQGKPVASAYKFSIYSWKGTSLAEELHCKCCGFTGSFWKIEFCSEGPRTYKEKNKELIQDTIFRTKKGKWASKS